jgi:serine/threonine-protein kinase HipA
MQVLDAWLEGQFVGQFEAGDSRGVNFRYDTDAPETPISLSLPRDRPASSESAAHFLDNFLPDHPATRSRMARAYGAASTSTFDLLSKSGGDIAGGLVLLPVGTDFAGEAPALDIASEADIANRIATIKRDPDAWVPTNTLARFSLGGTQGKFALALVDGDWYWSNASVPSTHILKPARPQLRNLESAESAALALASKIGLAAPAATVLTVEDQSTYMVERFDRIPGSPFATRLHVEDLAQASGTSPNDKYGLTALQAFAVLAPEDTNNRLVHTFVEQLAFNVLLGNADAHAKNYSIILRPSGVEMSPLYDTVPVGLYPFEQSLAMRISGAEYSQEAGPGHWRKLAVRAGLDPDEVLATVVGIAEGIATNIDTAWVDLEEDQQVLLREQLLRNTDKVLGRERNKLFSTPEARSSRALTRNKDVGILGNGGSFAHPSQDEPDSDRR